MKVNLQPKEKAEFIKILKILNHYYSMRGDKGKDFQFREFLIKSQLEDFSIEAEKLSKFEYQITATTITGDSRQWIHLDGIAEERERFSDKKDHPVFSITSLGDLFEASKK